MSYTYLLTRLEEIAGVEAAQGRVLLAHLGSGASMAAVCRGRPIDTTMAFTPTAGLVMGTRPGGLDPCLLVYMMRVQKMSPEQMDAWTADFDNWATVDGTCGYLFCRTAYAYDKAFEWAGKKPEFVKRAGFSLMAYLAVHDKRAGDAKLAAFLPVIEKHSDDDRNFVRKAVNWALRQIGKRNLDLNKLAIETAERIKLQNTKPARWIAADALRELTNEKTLERLKSKSAASKNR